MPIPCGARLELSVEFLNPVERFKHLGRVVRCTDVQRDLIVVYRIGVELLRRSGSADTAWQKAVERRRDLIIGGSLPQQNDNRFEDDVKRGANTGGEHENEESPTGA